MGGGKYGPPNLQIIFTGFYKHESDDISAEGDCGTSEWAKPEAYPCITHYLTRYSRLISKKIKVVKGS